jgi:signal transduction histidine kinase
MQFDSVGALSIHDQGDDLAASLEQMLDGYAVLRAVREAGEIVDFEWEYINAVGAATYGRSAEELIGSRLRSVVPGITEGGVFDERCAVVETGVPILRARVNYGEHALPGVFDSRVWKHGDGYAILWRDVTEIATAQAAARANHERFRSTVEHLPDSVSVFEAVRDADGAIVDFRWVYANPAAADMIGRSVEALCGSALLDVLPEHAPGGMFDVYVRVVETGEPFLEETLWYEDVWGDAELARRRAFDVRATKVGDGFVVVTREVTNVRESAERERLRHSLLSAERERRRWARELHDSTLQNLAALKLMLSTARHKADAAGIDAAIDDAIELLGSEVRDLRALITDLRPAALDDAGVAAALAALAERATTLYDLDVSVQVDFGCCDTRLEPDLETAIYRTAQEAVTNVCKHAGARHAAIAVLADDDDVKVEVSDDGHGFDPADVAGGFGVIGMRERAELAGGRIEISSSPAGTTVRAVLPRGAAGAG